MAISRRNRRPIDVEGRPYVWWVAPDDEEASGGLVLSVASEDKHFLVKYQLVQEDDTRYLVVLGREFRQQTDCGGAWRRFRCPAFGSSKTVAPKDVVALVRWAMMGDDALVEVNWLGWPVPVTKT